MLVLGVVLGIIGGFISSLFSTYYVEWIKSEAIDPNGAYTIFWSNTVIICLISLIVVVLFLLFFSLWLLRDKKKTVLPTIPEAVSKGDVNMELLIRSTDEIFVQYSKNLFKTNHVMLFFQISLGALIGLVLLNLIEGVNVSLVVAIVAVTLAFLSFFQKINDKNTNSIKDEIVDSVIISYNNKLNRDTNKGSQVIEETIVRKLIILRSKNKKLPLYHVYLSNSSIFDMKRLLERIYS